MLDDRTTSNRVYELWSDAGNLVDTFATLAEARAASDPSDVGITAVENGEVVGSFNLGGQE